MLNSKITLWRNIFKADGVDVPIKRVLKGIKDGQWKSHVEKVRGGDKEAKKYLPSAFFSGTFDGLTSDDITTYNGIIVLDIDSEDPDHMKEAFEFDKHTIACFASPSGNGLKVLIQGDCDMYSHQDVFFPAISNYVKDKYFIDIDQKCSNLNRHAFVSYDPDLYINDNPQIFKIPKKYYNPVEESAINYNDYDVSSNSSQIFRQLVKWQNESDRYQKGNRNNFIFKLLCQMNRYAIPMDMSINFIRSRYISFKESELIASAKSCYMKYNGEFGTKKLILGKKSNNGLF